MTTSINTNYGALVALQAMNRNSMELNEVQTRINTGFKVNNAKDDGAIYAIAQTQRGRQSHLVALQSGIDRGTNLLDTTQTAGQQIADALLKMRDKAAAAASGGLSATQIASYQSEFNSLRDSITAMANSAVFNGNNLIGTGPNTVNVLINDRATPDQITLTGVALDATGLGVAATTFATQAAAQTALTALDTAIATVNTTLATFGAQAKALDSQKIFLSKLADTVEKGIGQMVDADLAKESARLQSAQIKQQLGAQALSIANQAPQIITQLFGQ